MITIMIQQENEIMSIFKTESELDSFVKKLIESKVQEAKENRQYKSDAERRELVRQLRKVEAEEKTLREEGNTAEAEKKSKEAQRIIEELFYEVELGIYKLANSLSSGSKSTRSGSEDSPYIHNTEEDLKAVGTREFIRVVEGGEYTDSNGTRKTGFDPDGPGSFMAFTMKCVEGVMKNQHKKEAKHRDEISLDAPRGEHDEEETTNLYNNIFADSDLRFDAIGDDQYEKFMRSDAFDVLMDCLDDICDSQRNIEVFKHYYGVDGFDKMTPTQIGEKYGFSKQRVNNIVTKLINRLRDYFSDERQIINENSEEERFIIKVGDKYVSSPSNVLTKNKNFAGIIHGRDKADNIVKYWQSQGVGKVIADKWENKHEFINEAISPALNGLTLKAARKKIREVWDAGNVSGCFHDESWEPVNAFWDRLREAKIDFELIESKYGNESNESGMPTTKTWKILFKFINQNGKDCEIYGSIVASGCGTVEQPLESYDLVFQCY